MNYYENIKEILVNNEITKKVKDYSKNRSDLESYYNVGKLLVEAQGGLNNSEYGNELIKKYSRKLTKELGKGYSWRNLYNMRTYYIFVRNNENLQTLSANLSWSHYVELLNIENVDEIKYYISVSSNITVRQLREKIRNKEYERLPEETKNKMLYQKETDIQDFVKHPIVIKSNGQEIISEKVLQKIILEDISSFLKELGSGFTFIENEYKIKIGDRYNYIDLLLYNIPYNCYVVVELKIIELKKEHIGQIKVYMNYIDKNLKTINQDKTIGIIICKEDNHFLMEYCSDSRIFSTNYITI